MQTEVLSTMPIGVPGQIADTHTDLDGRIGSATNTEASAEIPFGVMVKRGATDDSAKLLAAQADIDDLLGVSVFAESFDKPVQLGDDGLKPGVTFGTLLEGDILVLVEDAVTPASEVHVRAVAVAPEIAGAFRGTDDGTDTIDVSAFCNFRTSADAGELAVLHVDMAGRALGVADS